MDTRQGRDSTALPDYSSFHDEPGGRQDVFIDRAGKIVLRPAFDIVRDFRRVSPRSTSANIAIPSSA